jgi:hypothetical protein
MAVRKKTTVEKAVKKSTKKAEKVVTEFESGDVILADEVEEVVKNDTVTVCSNFPRDVVFTATDNAGKTVDILIRGNGGFLRGKGAGVLSIGAYGITMNVPKEAWKQISTIYKDDARFKDGLIFATTANKARSEAKERKALRNGFEPIEAKDVKVKANEE